MKLYESTTASLEKRLEQGMIDAAFLHPPLHVPDLAETFPLSTPMALFDGDPDPMTAEPTSPPWVRSDKATLFGNHST